MFTVSVIFAECDNEQPQTQQISWSWKKRLTKVEPTGIPPVRDRSDQIVNFRIATLYDLIKIRLVSLEHSSAF